MGAIQLQLEEQLRGDIAPLVFGILLSALGAAALALSAFRWKRKDVSLISFGSFCLLYGVRLLARMDTIPLLIHAGPLFWAYLQAFITYVAPVPFVVFVEQLLGKGWKSSIRGLLYVQVFYATGAILVDSFLLTPAAAMGPNPYLVILMVLVGAAHAFRPGLPLTSELRVLRAGFLVFGVFALNDNLVSGQLVPWRLSAEPLGMFIFVCFLGYVTAHRVFAREKQLLAIMGELETARRIQSFILPRAMPDVPGLDIAARYVPVAAVAGDFYDFLLVDERRVGILVADVSGHGVPAALVASMLKVALASQSAHAADPARVLAGMNQIFCGKLESEFVTAAYLFVDTGQKTMVYAGAGHPPLLMYRKAERKIHELRENGTILGRFPDAQYSNASLPLQPGDRMVLYTDGILEAENAAGEFFGEDRLKSFVNDHEGLPPARFADSLLEQICSWSGKSSGTALDDDLTLLVVDVEGSAPGAPSC